ncbi:hypothetical protein HS1genome_1604 [Sulfodiicoccus acidiphilus]|uniref:Uncharacterized protein n=1 Tax=Sulfodiicoccus acidiphilus TaxID=1670455 RepID=A0A348B4W3_9CREN|nr:hypothetical protein [Sulfodiicoccus acidiphilus]BBD73215.1 hypothetical protein HS1genome_1604 [Sulfodiicoccus acidiphilus]GGU04869.1 hypothetical protein GCM10007116_21820 [Sulfodiicoccus acidiphilus]
MEYTTQKLDGIIGWLTEFGHRCLRAKEVKESIGDDVLESAMKTTVEEFSHFSREYIILTSSPPWKGDGSLSEGSSFPPSVRVYIPRLVGSRVDQRSTPI